MVDALTVFKGLADGTRLNILNELAREEVCAEDLANKLKLTQATVSFHMKKLATAGLITQRRDKYRIYYALNKSALAPRIIEIALAQPKLGSSEQFRAKVIKSFMPCGYCETLPAQMKKRLVIFEEIIKKFEPGKAYPEREVNEIISTIHADYCYVRRAFVGMGWMTRAAGIYTVTGVTPAPEGEI